MKYFGLINLNINFNSSCEPCPLVCISDREVLVYTFTPLKYNLLTVLDILSAFPGIADDEKITISSFCNLICL